MPDPTPSDRPDPYAVRRPDEGADTGDHGPGGRTQARLDPSAGAARDVQPPDPDTARQARTLGLLAAIAAVMAIVVPPAGVVLGVVTLVLAARRRSRDRFARIGLSVRAASVAGGVFALVVGGLLSLVSVLLGEETGQLRECLAGANTRVAERICQNEFMDALQSRLTGD